MNNKLTIGSLIEQEVRRQQIPITEFAKIINCKRNNVYDIFKRSTIDTVLLKRVSKILGHNFFQDLADDPELTTVDHFTDEQRKNNLAVSQFLSVVPEILLKLGKDTPITFDNAKPGYEDCPDFKLLDYNISFTIGDTFKDRIGNNFFLSIEEDASKTGDKIEICTFRPYSYAPLNINIYHSVFLNIKITNRTAEEWERLLRFAFEVYSKKHIKTL